MWDFRYGWWEGRGAQVASTWRGTRDSRVGFGTFMFLRFLNLELRIEEASDFYHLGKIR